MISGDINQATIAGTLVEDPVLCYTAMGHALCEFHVVTTVYWSESPKAPGVVGRIRESTERHCVVVWGDLAEIVATTFRRDDKVHVEGRIQTRSYESRNGGKTYTEIVADKVQRHE